MKAPSPSLAFAAVLLLGAGVVALRPGTPSAQLEGGLTVVSAVHSFHADSNRKAPNRGGVIYQAEISLAGADFVGPPVVFLSVVQAEFEGDRVEYYVTPTNITPASFTLQVWGADRMDYGEFSVQWLAIGPSASPLVGQAVFPWPPDVVD